MWLTAGLATASLQSPGDHSDVSSVSPLKGIISQVLKTLVPDPVLITHEAFLLFLPIDLLIFLYSDHEASGKKDS